MPLVTYFASIGIRIFDYSSTLMRIWKATHSSPLGAVCLIGTWPTKIPARSDLTDVYDYVTIRLRYDYITLRYMT